MALLRKYLKFWLRLKTEVIPPETEILIVADDPRILAQKREETRGFTRCAGNGVNFDEFSTVLDQYGYLGLSDGANNYVGGAYMAETIKRRHVNPWFTTVVSGMASYIDAASIITSGIALVIYQTSFALDTGQFGLLSAALTFCIAIGSIFGGRLGDRYGRKPVFSATMIMLIIGGALLLFMPLAVPTDVTNQITDIVTAAKNAAPETFSLTPEVKASLNLPALPGFFFPMLLLGQILMGLGVGADLPVSLATIAEEASDNERGKMLLFSDILWVVGIIIANAFGSAFGNMGVTGGMIMYAQLVVVSTIVLILRQLIPESEVWLKAHEDRLSGKVTEEESSGKVSDLMKQPYVVPFVALIIFYIGTNVPANTLGQFSTYVATNVVRIDVALASTIGLITYPIRALFDVVFMKFVDTDKRMPLFYFGAILYVCGFLAMPIFGASTVTYVVTQLLYCIGAAFAFEGILKVWMQECFPTLLRTTANGTIVFASRMCCAVFGYFTANLIAGVGYRAAFAILAVMCVMGYIAAIYAFHGKRYNTFADEEKESK
jgi:inositol transporter-like SP family MFS transporter